MRTRLLFAVAMLGAIALGLLVLRHRTRAVEGRMVEARLRLVDERQALTGERARLAARLRPARLRGRLRAADIVLVPSVGAAGEAGLRFFAEAAPEAHVRGGGAP
jgi:hypothetical protein